jgi:hypothetical protein
MDDFLQYYLRDCGRVSGPFDLKQLQWRWQRGQLARSSQVSIHDDQHWQPLESIPEIFQSSESKSGTHRTLRPPALVPPLPPAPAPVPRWYYRRGAESLGPVDAAVMKEIVGWGEIGPDCLVWCEGMPSWVSCRQVKDFATGRFVPPLPGVPAPSSLPPLPVVAATVPPEVAPPRAAPGSSRKARSRRRPAVFVLPGTACLALGALVWFGVSAMRSVPPSGTTPKVVEPAQLAERVPPTELPRSDAVPQESGRGIPAEPIAPQPAEPDPAPPAPPGDPPRTLEPRLPVPAPAPGPPESQPGPPTLELVAVNLPRVSTSLTTSDGSIYTFDTPLPDAGPYELRLLGLDAPELHEAFLACGSPDPPQAETLVVFRTGKDMGDRQELGRFWIEEGMLKFQWIAPPFTRALFESSRALRDCLLEVRGASGATQEVALRKPVSDARPITIAEGSRSLDWRKGGDAPRRRLVIKACSVRVEGRWVDIPAGNQPDRREYRFDSESPQPLTLQVGISEDTDKITAALDPSLKEISDELRRMTKEKASFKREFERRRAHINSMGQDAVLTESQAQELSIQRAQSSLSGARAQAGMVRDEADRKKLQHSSLQEQYRERETAFKKLESNYMRMSMVRRTVESYIKTPIRLRLGIVVGKTMCDVAEIGFE